MSAEFLHSSDHERLTIRECAIHGLLLLVVVAILFPGTFLRGEHAIPGELLYKYEPWSLYKPSDARTPDNELLLEPLMQTFFWYAQAKKTIDAGEWPLWNPLQFCGTPLLANFQSAVFYPPRIVHALFDFVTATTIFILLRVWLCGATAYWCGRAIGLGRAGARFLSLGWMLCMYNMVWVYWPVPDVSAWAPVLFLGVERILQRRYRQGFFAIAVGGTLILLAGHPETAFTLALGIGAYFLIRLALERRWGRRLWVPLVVAGAAWVPVLLICAVQLLPFMEYLVNSFTYATRTASHDAVPTLLSRGLVALWVPRFFGANMDGNFWGLKEDASASFAGNPVGNTNHVSYIYVGIVAWIAIGLAMSRFGSDRLTRDRWIALMLPGIAGLLLALEHPILGFVHEWPLFSSIVRTYYVNFLLLALVVIGAIGIDALSREALTLRALRWPVLMAVIVAFFVGGSYAVQRAAIPDAEVGRYVLAQLALALVFALTAIVTAGVAIKSGKCRVGALLLSALLAADLLVAARGIRWTSPREHINVRTALFDYLNELDGDARFTLMTGRVLPGVSQMYGIEMMNGYDAILPERFRRLVVNSSDYWGTLEPSVSAKYYVYRKGEVDSDTPKFQHLKNVDGFNVVENRRAFDRAYLVGSVEIVPDSDALFRRLADVDFDPAQRVLTTAPPEGDLPSSAGVELGIARLVSRTPTSVSVEVNANAPCVLVLSDTFYPGWVAQLNAVEVDVFPANYAFRGVLVPEGQHVVEFEYRPLSFRVGLAVSTLSAILSVILIGAVYWCHRSQTV